MDNQSFENKVPQVESVQHEQPTTEAPSTSANTTSLSSITNTDRSKKVRYQEAMQLQKIAGNQAVSRAIQKKESPTTPQIPPLDLSGLSGVIQRQESSNTTSSEVIQAAMKANYTTSSKKTEITSQVDSVASQGVNEGNKAEAVGITMDDWGTGSQPSDNVRAVSRAATVASGKNPLYVAGHLLNHHLGGPGNQQNNITAFSNRANSKHLHGIEKFVKKDVQAGKTVYYSVEITKRDHKQTGNGVEVENLASEMKAKYGILKDGEAPDKASNYDTELSVTIDLPAGKEGVTVETGTDEQVQGISLEQDLYQAIFNLMVSAGVTDEEYDQAFALMNEVVANSTNGSEAVAQLHELSKSFALSTETIARLAAGIPTVFPPEG